MDPSDSADYHFSFVQANGTRQRRAVFYEGLYVFSQGPQHVLAAARVVPHQDLLFATYLALKKSLDAKRSTPLLGSSAPSRVNALALIDQAGDQLPTTTAFLPPTITAQVERLLDDSVDKIMVEQGIAPYLETAPKPRSPMPLEEQFAPPTGHILADFNGEDMGWVHLGNKAHYQLQKQAEDWADETLNLVDGRPLPALRRELEDELSRALYSNPQYLELVKRVLKARGGFTSSLARHFTLFCLKQLKENMANDDEDSTFWRQRLESHIGRAATRGPGLVPHYSLTLLGFIDNELPDRDPQDPQQTPHSYRVDPQCHPADLDLLPITSLLRRYFFKTLARAYFRQPIAHIRYLDEEDLEQLPDYLAA